MTAKRSTRILFRRRWLIRLDSSRVSSFAGSRARPRNDDGECLPIMVTDDEARRGLSSTVHCRWDWAGYCSAALELDIFMRRF